MMKTLLRRLTINPLGDMPGWAKKREAELLASIAKNNAASADRRTAIRVAAEKDAEVMRERHRSSQG